MLTDLSRSQTNADDHEYEIEVLGSRSYEQVEQLQAPPSRQEQQRPSPDGGYEMTQCPAYTIFSNQNTETQSPTLSSDSIAATKDQTENSAVYSYVPIIP